MTWAVARVGGSVIRAKLSDETTAGGRKVNANPKRTRFVSTWERGGTGAGPLSLVWQLGESMMCSSGVAVRREYLVHTSGLS